MVSSTNKTDGHIIEILLKVALNTITLTLLVGFGFKKRIIYTELDIYVIERDDDEVHFILDQHT